MTLEAGKQMDKYCVLNWLNEIYVAPSRTYNRYTDDEYRMFAHDALILLEDQEPKESKWIDHLYRFNDKRFECGSCHRTSWKNTPFCPWCGLKMTGTEIDKDFSEGAGK